MDQPACSVGKSRLKRANALIKHERAWDNNYRSGRTCTFVLPTIDLCQAERAPGSPETEALSMGTIKLPKNRHQQFFIIFVVLSCSPFEVLQCFQPVLSRFRILTRWESAMVALPRRLTLISKTQRFWHRCDRQSQRKKRKRASRSERHIEKIWKNQINAACQNIIWPYEAQYDIRSQFILVLVCLWDPFPCRSLPRHWQILLKLEITLRILILVVKVQLHCRSTKLVCTVVRKTTLPYLAYFDTSLNWPGPSSLQFQMGRVIMSRFKIILWNCGTVIKPYPIRLFWFYSLDGRVNSEVGHSQVQLPCLSVQVMTSSYAMFGTEKAQNVLWQLPQRRQKISHWQRQETV